jgi:hypothetical protein
MFGGLLQKAASAGKRLFGHAGGVVRKLADTTSQVVRKVGNFAISNHQGLGLLAKGIGDASGNETLKKVGDAAMIGSAYLTTQGIGHDYTGLRRILDPST